MMIAMKPPPLPVYASNAKALAVANPNRDLGDLKPRPLGIDISDFDLEDVTDIDMLNYWYLFQFMFRTDELRKKRKMNELMMNSLDQNKPEKRIKKMAGVREMKNNETMMMKMVCGSCYLPKYKPEDPEFQGEDAHFVYEEGQTIGVADGIGSWVKKGIDSGVYARQLMKHAKNEAAAQIAGGASVVNPKKALVEAFGKNLDIQGSSTACILSFDTDKGYLRVVNVGDSGFMVFRDNVFAYKSKTQQTRFNRPYQLGNHPSCDPLDSADAYAIKFLPGDIIVLGTDGLLDNMFPTEIEQILGDWSNRCKDKKWCEDLAVYIADRACFNSNDEEYISHFMMEAMKYGLEYERGGKIDDITVMVAIAVDRQDN